MGAPNYSRKFDIFKKEHLAKIIILQFTITFICRCCALGKSNLRKFSLLGCGLVINVYGTRSSTGNFKAGLITDCSIVRATIDLELEITTQLGKHIFPLYLKGRSEFFPNISVNE